jgi:hypothetical protein
VVTHTSRISRVQVRIASTPGRQVVREHTDREKPRFCHQQCPPLVVSCGRVLNARQISCQKALLCEYLTFCLFMLALCELHTNFERSNVCIQQIRTRCGHRNNIRGDTVSFYGLRALLSYAANTLISIFAKTPICRCRLFDRNRGSNFESPFFPVPAKRAPSPATTWFLAPVPHTVHLCRANRDSLHIVKPHPANAPLFLENSEAPHSGSSGMMLRTQ